MLKFFDIDPSNDFRGGLISRHYLVSVQVYTNPELPGPINKHINSYYGGKSRRNRRKSKRTRRR